MRRRTQQLLRTALVLALASACSDSNDPIPTPAITVSFGPTTSFSVARGQTQTFPVTITRSGGFSGSVTVSISGLPEGVNVGCNPAAVLGSSATLSVAATVGAPVGTFTATAKATGSGVTTQTTLLTITVTQ